MRKKFTMILALMFLCMGAWAQTTTYRGTNRTSELAEGTKYMIYNATNAQDGWGARSGIIYNNNGHVATDASLMPKTLVTTDTKYLWEVVKGSETNQYSLKSVSTGQYAAIGGAISETNNTVYITPWADAVTAGFAATGGAMGFNNEAGERVAIANAAVADCLFTISSAANGGTCWNGNPGSFTTWSTAHPITFYEVEEVTAVTVRYSFVFGGEEKYVQEVICPIGDEFPDFNVDLPWGVSAGTKPAGTVTVNNKEQDIALTIDNSVLPFVYADSYENIGENWYYMPLHTSSKYYLEYKENQEYIPLGSNQQTLPADGHDAYLWAFVGNPFDGYKIMNKAAGAGMILSSSTNTADGNTGGNTYPLMKQESGLTTGTDNIYWIPTASTYATNGFYLAQQGNSNNKMNARSGKLAYWNTGADAGSTFRVTTLAEFDEYGISDLLDDAGKVGYPATTSAAYTTLNGLEEGRATKLEVEPAISAYKTTTDIVLPEDGKAYTIANYSRNEKTRYLNYTAGSALSVSEDASNASVFVCKKLSNGVYTLVTSDGKVLTWMNSGEGYKENDAYNGYSTEYGTSYSGYTDWNKIAIKKNGTGEVDYGFLRMVARRASGNSSFIIKGSTGAWDKAGDNYFFDNSGNYFSSAWALNEVAHENSDAEDLAIAKIAAKYTLESKPLGEGIGKYHFVIDGENSYTTDALNNATTADAVNAIASSLTINQPATGFYRIKTTGGQYLQLNEGQNGFELAAEYNKIRTLLYLDGENTILSYSCGQYLNDYTSPANVGTEGLSWAISENNDVAGAYALKRNGATANNEFFSYWSGVTYGLNDAAAAWIFEEVAWLPVAINAEVGYATFYSPVELELSQNRVKAYTGKVNGKVLKLTEQEVVPANTGVILELQEGAEVENGYTFLQVKETTLTGLDNDLAGTFAKTYVTEASYVLAQKNDVVGLYKATMNQLDGTAFLNNAFKAYLPAPANATAPMFSFDRGEGTTGIESSELNTQPTVIYDLLGRRVEKMEKGIYIVNGKKIIK